MATVRRLRRSSSLACKCKTEDFRSAGLKFLLSAFFVDRQASTRRSSGVLAHLHVCSTRCADLAYSSPSLACQCESEDFRPMRGV